MSSALLQDERAASHATEGDSRSVIKPGRTTAARLNVDIPPAAKRS
jgi:hypothetical protein